MKNKSEFNDISTEKLGILSASMKLLVESANNSMKIYEKVGTTEQFEESMDFLEKYLRVHEEILEILEDRL